MPASATLMTVSPNCENVDFHLSGGAINPTTGGQVYINIYLVNEDGTEYSKTGEEYLTMDYGKLTPLLIEAIKEQQAQIDELNIINAFTK